MTRHEADTLLATNSYLEPPPLPVARHHFLALDARQNVEGKNCATFQTRDASSMRDKRKHSSTQCWLDSAFFGGGLLALMIGVSIYFNGQGGPWADITSHLTYKFATFRHLAGNHVTTSPATVRH